MNEFAPIAAWTSIAECPVPSDVQGSLVTSERAVATYRTFQNSAIFTNKRLHVHDAQSLTKV